MKKIVLAIGLVVSVTKTTAQTITFEDLNLTPNSGWNGSDLTGFFTSNSQIFTNVYYPDFGGYWGNGWGYSNKTDITTAGYINELSSFAGSGSNSANYAICYSSAYLDFGVERIVTSADFTNNTFAGISMRDGDAYGKQFGSVNGANGLPDGTNGEDFFRLNIIGRDADSLVTDTIVFYLADFRFADNALDYIQNTWQNVNLSSLGEIRYLSFELESSDVSGGYLNTPAYFAMDNLNLSSAGIVKKELTVSVYPNPSTDFISLGNQTGVVRILSLDGKLQLEKVISTNEQISTSELNSGTYLLELQSNEGTGRVAFVKI